MQHFIGMERIPINQFYLLIWFKLSGIQYTRLADGNNGTETIFIYVPTRSTISTASNETG